MVFARSRGCWSQLRAALAGGSHSDSSESVKQTDPWGHSALLRQGFPNQQEPGNSRRGTQQYRPTQGHTSNVLCVVRRDSVVRTRTAVDEKQPPLTRSSSLVHVQLTVPAQPSGRRGLRCPRPRVMVLDATRPL